MSNNILTNEVFDFRVSSFDIDKKFENGRMITAYMTTDPLYGGVHVVLLKDGKRLWDMDITRALVNEHIDITDKEREWLNDLVNILMFFQNAVPYITFMEPNNPVGNTRACKIKRYPGGRSRVSRRAYEYDRRRLVSCAQHILFYITT